ncbi:heptaprenyl diphosphate synthase component 1 [Paenibacillus sp. FA6]|uniref:heptaprenyl diphosphate synthase component 1 n=1 Tax=Paenibacillus sp. FA6 TaxID=3413029 RepID=UPI003F655ACC
MKSYRIPQLASSYIEYDMIEQYTKLPKFPDARVHLLYIFLNIGSRKSIDHTELYAMVTSLIQMGLDTHETIDTEQGNQAEVRMRSRQLKVLAGDYYSSRFYQLLSDQGQIEVITQLSRAICDLNMMKMNLYSSIQARELTSEQYLEQKVQLNMQLFLSFSPMIENSLRDSWEKLLREFSLCETVMIELDHNEEGIPYISKECLLNTLHESVERVQRIRNSLKGDVLPLYIGQVLEPFQLSLNSSRAVVGEG